MSIGAAAPFGAPAEVARRPGVIWSYAPALGGLRLEEQPPDCPGFRWLHLNLADQRSQRWIEAEAGLPPAFAAFFAAPDIQPQLLVEGGALALVLPDLERDFDRSETGRLGALRIALAPGLVVSGRHHPVMTPDGIRRRLAEDSGVDDAAAAFELILSCLAETIATRTAAMTDRLLEAEDELLADRAPDNRMLIGVRRLSTQLHRITSGTRATLQRIESETRAAPALIAVAQRRAQRFHHLDGELIAAQAQLRLLRDELDLQTAQRTNRILYFLSLITGVMMPATLVTGFFGMNTGALPFTGAHGTFAASLLALFGSAATYYALRRVRGDRR